MRLPLFIPKEIEFIKNSESVDELLNQVMARLDYGLYFLEAVAEDDTWTEKNAESVSRFLKWLTRQYWNERVDAVSAEKIKALLQRSLSTLLPLLPSDITIMLEESEVPINSILFGTASPYFQEIVRAMREKKLKSVRLRCLDKEAGKDILEFLSKGSQNLWRKTQVELERMATQARSWDLEEIADESEGYLGRYLREENIYETIAKAHKNRWITLQKKACEYYNSLEKSLKLESDNEGKLTVEFLDLKILTTVPTYEKYLAGIAKRLKFRENLLLDDQFEVVLRMTPHLEGLDLTETTSPWKDLDMIPSSLSYLNLTRCPWLKDEHLTVIFSYFPNLKTLLLNDNTRLTFAAYGSMNKVVLEELSLKGLKQLTDDDARIIATAQKNLEKLNLEGCKKLTNTGLLHFIRNNNRLSDINFAYTQADDHIAAEILGSRFPLARVNLEGTSVSLDMKKKLA